MKRKRAQSIHTYFKPIGPISQPSEHGDGANTNDVQPSEENNPSHAEGDAQDVPVPEVTEEATVITTKYDRDPGRRPQIWQLPPEKQDDARRFYICEGAYQPELDNYEYNDRSAVRRRFQKDWYTNFWWLEYSTDTKCAYCLPCFLFSKKPVGKCGSDTFTVKGFDKWKKVNNGKECAFLKHMGTTPSSAHNFAVGCYENLRNRINHVDEVMKKQTKQRVLDARLRLKTSIDAMR